MMVSAGGEIVAGGFPGFEAGENVLKRAGGPNKRTRITRGSISLSRSRFFAPQHHLHPFVFLFCLEFIIGTEKRNDVRQVLHVW